MGNIVSISGLAVKVYTAYKDAPDDYRHISDEVGSLQIIINKAARYFEGTTIDDDTQQEGQEILRGCQSVLEGLNCLIEKYNSLASPGTGQVFQRIKLGAEDIATLRVRLISNTGLLNSFIQRSVIPATIQYIILIFLYLSCESHEIRKMQERMAGVLGLHSRDSTTSVTESINTQNIYKRFCRRLVEIGVTAEMISQKEEEILNIFKPQDTVEMISGKEEEIVNIFKSQNMLKSQDTTITSGERDDSNITDQRQLLKVSYFL